MDGTSWSAPNGGANSRLLIVDDDREFAESLVDLLVPRGYQVAMAHAPEDARGMATVFDAQVMLVDVRLGSESGVSLIESLKGIRPDALCIVMTAFADVDSAIEALKKGAYDYLRKPLNVPVFLATLDRAFDRVRIEEERARAKAALRDSEERFRALVETTNDWVWEVDADTRYTYVSPKVRDLLGYPPEAVVGKTPFDFMVPEDVERARQSFEDAKAQRKPLVGLEDGAVRADGQVIVLETNGVPVLDAHGTVVGFRGIDRDITQRKLAEAELIRHREHLQDLVEQRTRELQESREQLRRTERLASVGTLAAGIAHELNNPLGVIALAGENALESRKRPDGDALLAACLDDIAVNAERCRHIIRSVLQFSRQETAEKRPCDLRAVVDHAIGLTAGDVSRSHGHLELGLPADLPPIPANRLQLEQVFVNLIRNAVESGVGDVRIAITAEHRGQVVRVGVADNGRGIPAEELPHIFDPFFTTRRERGGTGLGLSIVHGIIAAHNGTVAVTSRPGAGTTFTIELPCVETTSWETERATRIDR